MINAEIVLVKQKLWSSGRVLGSRLEGVKAMPGLIPAPNPGSFNIRKERKYR